MNDLSAAPHPERQRKPDWIRVKAPVSKGYQETRALMRELNLNTVCEEAACPNIGECWTKKHATVMILGDVCTRACAFCNVKTGMPRMVDPLEPDHVAAAAARLGLEHIVVTSVDRDDLPDGVHDGDPMVRVPLFQPGRGCGDAGVAIQRYRAELLAGVLLGERAEVLDHVALIAQAVDQPGLRRLARPPRGRRCFLCFRVHSKPLASPYLLSRG